MSVEGVVNLISSVGFPIVMCLAFFRFITEQTKKRDVEISEMKKLINSTNETLIELRMLIKHYLNEKK